MLPAWEGGAGAVDRALHRLFAEIAEGRGLAEAAEGVGALFGCHLVALHREAPGRPGSVEVSGDLAVSDLMAIHSEYARRWQAENLWIARSDPLLLARGYQSTDEIVDLREMQATDYYRQVLHPVDIAHAVGIGVSAEPGRAILAFNRSRQHGPLDAGELAMVAALRPHLVTAASLHEQLSRLGASHRALRDAFDRTPVATIVMDRHGWVRELNGAAQALLVGREHGVTLAPGGALVFAHAPVRESFLAALRRIALEGASPHPVAVSARPSGAARNLFMHLCPAPGGGVVATLVDSDRARDDAYAVQALQAVLRLTVQEARVCLALRALGEPEAVAQHLGLQVSTVRSHLKRAFEKSGASRQSELVRVVDRIVSTAPMT